MMGSSPRARGALLRRPTLRRGQGLIPACAGSTTPSRTRPISARAHPRVRGEHRDGVITRLSIGGSSPRARGARSGSRSRLGRIRLIPACAGSTMLDHAERSLMRAHPRVRGEHRPTPAHGGGGSWLIPACAGSTTAHPRPPGQPPAHPRVRGEHLPTNYAVRSFNGSSPRARGAPCQLLTPM